MIAEISGSQLWCPNFAKILADLFKKSSIRPCQVNRTQLNILKTFLKYLDKIA